MSQLQKADSSAQRNTSLSGMEEGEGVCGELSYQPQGGGRFCPVTWSLSPLPHSPPYHRKVRKGSNSSEPS